MVHCALNFESAQSDIYLLMLVKVFQDSVVFSQSGLLNVLNVQCTLCTLCATYTAHTVCFLIIEAQCSKQLAVWWKVWGHTTTWTGAHMSHDLDTDDDDDHDIDTDEDDHDLDTDDDDHDLKNYENDEDDDDPYNDTGMA